jgi:hypothetical protein
VNHTIGDFPSYTEIFIKKDGVDWNTYVSDSEGYISFTYDEGITTITFEAQAGSDLPQENYTILKPGWNLISVPRIQVDQDITCVLDPIYGLYDAVQWLDASDTIDPWKHNKVGKPFGNDLFEVNETMGFWIHITQPGGVIFEYNGNPPTENQGMILYSGWNLVGYPSLTSYNRTEGLNNITFQDDVDFIQWYDASTQTWYSMDEDDYFKKGVGYCIHSTKGCIWEVPL